MGGVTGVKARRALRIVLFARALGHRPKAVTLMPILVDMGPFVVLRVCIMIRLRGTHLRLLIIQALPFLCI